MSEISAAASPPGKITLHWNDGRETEYTVHAYEMNLLDRTLKIWGAQTVVTGQGAISVPLVYHDRPYGLFDMNMIDRIEVDREECVRG